MNSADLYVAAAPVASNAPPPQVIDSTSLSYRAHATHAKHPLLRLTHVHKGGNATLKEDPISAGVPSFVIQEEFDRFTGYWWQPVQYGGPTPDRFRILYEETDESDVQILNFADTDGQVRLTRDFVSFLQSLIIHNLLILSFADKFQSKFLIQIFACTDAHFG